MLQWLNWVLAPIAVVLWVAGYCGYFFQRQIREWWRRRFKRKDKV